MTCVPSISTSQKSPFGYLFWPMVVLSRVVTWRQLLARSIKEEDYESSSDVVEKEDELLAKQRGNSKVYENGEVSSTRI